MIVIEGADNVGKTTLVNKLIERDPALKVLKRPRSNASQDRSIGQSYIQTLIPEDGDFVSHGYSVVDRLLASECIYGEMFRGGCRMTPREYLIIRQLLVGYHALIVHCDIPDEKIMESWGERHQLYPVDPVKIAREYRRRIESIFKVPVIKHDWTLPDADQHVEHLIKLHQHVQETFLKYKKHYFNILEDVANR